MIDKMKKNLWVWIALLVLVVAVAVTAALLLWRTPSGSGLEFFPTITTTSGTTNTVQVEPDSAFLIGGSEEMEDTALYGLIVLEPEIGYSLTRDTTQGMRWVLTPAKPLPAGETFTIHAGTKASRFAIAPTLLVTGSSPLDGSTQMNTRTGIELRFNTDQIDEKALESAITISPEAAYHIGSGNGRFVLYADDPLAYSTKYTVTLSSALESTEGWALREDYNLSFTTISEAGERAQSLFTLSGSAPYNTLTDETPLLQTYFDESAMVDGNAPKLDVTLYSYPNAEAYKTAVQKNLLTQISDGKGGGQDAYSQELSKLTQYATFVAEPFPLAGDDAYSRGSSMVAFPDNLPEGYYLAELRYSSSELEADGQPYVVKRYKLIQSSDLSVFFMHTGKDMLLWVNDAATGNPAKDAQFLLEGKQAGRATTGEDGTALLSSETLKVEDWGDTNAFTIGWEGHTYVGGTVLSPDYNASDPNQLYNSTLFTDRPLYQSTDTVQVWGMARPRRAETKLPVLTLQMEGVDPITVTPDEKGLFTATLELDNIYGEYGYGYLELLADGIRLDGESLRVYDYIKPIYTATITPDRPVYLRSEGVMPVLDINVSLFDGTPVPEFQGAIRNRWEQPNLGFINGNTIVTDKDGHATLQATSLVRDDNTWYPRTYAVQLANESAEAENFLSSAYVNVVPRDLMLLGKATVQGDKARVILSTNRVDISRIKESTDLWFDTEAMLKGPPVSVEIKAKLCSKSYTKTQSGVSYDYITRESVPIYSYAQVEAVEQEFTVTTDANGSYILENLPISDPEKQYYLEFSALDSAGERVDNTIWLSLQRSRSSQREAYRYGLGRVVNPAKLQANLGGSEGVSYWAMRSEFEDNETTNFILQNNDLPVETMKGRILYATVQDKIENVQITDKNAVSIPFAEALLPNYTLTGAYFDGKHIFVLEDTAQRFNPAQRELEIVLDTDKDDYAPGEQVTLNTTITEKVSGKPAANADMVLAVVDEAIFALQEQYVDPLGDLYTSVFYPTITKYASFNGPEYNGAGEKGGGGGDESVREKFPDTAFFTTAITDTNGKAQFTFTLPDSITNWRMTALALTENNRAGDNKANINATKDFFVVPMRSQELLEGDDVVIGLRSAGKGVTAEDGVQYSVTLEGNNLNQTTEVTTEGIRKYGWATFSGLPAGDYTVTVKGSCKTYTDAVKLPLTILKSGIEVSRVKTVELTDGLTVDTLRFPVSLNLYDKRYALYNQVLWSVRSASYGQRTDVQLARAFTDDLLNRANKSGNRSSSDIDLDKMSANGPLRMFSFDEQDLRLTAMAHELMEYKLDASVAMYHERKYSVPTQKFELAAPGAFYLVQARLGLLDTQVKVDTAGFSFVDQMDLAVAYATAGEKERATKLYSELVTPNLKKMTGISGAEALYLPEMGGVSGKDCTAAASHLAMVLEHPDTDGLMRYLLDRPSRYDPYIMEKLLYLKYKGKSAAENPAQLRYNLNGKEVTRTLDSSFISLTLSRNQLAELNVKVLGGDVLADICYTAAPTDADAANKKLTIVKTIEPVDSDNFVVGDLVKVTLTPDVSGFAKGVGDSEIIIDDYLPSAMKFDRFQQYYKANEAYWSMVSRENQRLRFSTYVDRGSMVPIVYYARNAMPGTYLIEGSFISSGAGDVWGSGERGTVTIAAQEAANPVNTP